MFNSLRKWRPLFIGACIGLGVGAVRSIITHDAGDLFGFAIGGVLFGAMYERWEWFVYAFRTKFAKKTKIDRRLVLAVFIGFWTLMAADG
jgi:hypothetical protein